MPKFSMHSLKIINNSLPEAHVGVFYSEGLTASGGESPYTWTATNLPKGLNIAGAKITGTPTKAETNFTTLEVKDMAHQTASVTLSFTVVPQLQITTTSLPPAVVGQAYSQTLTATGGVLPYTWSTTAPLPSGLTLTSAGVLSGTPTAPGSFSSSFTVTDNS